MIQNRIIINITTDGLTHKEAVGYVAFVIDAGKISQKRVDNKTVRQYCFLTVWEKPDGDVTVAADVSKKGTHIFYVSKYKGTDNVKIHEG